MALIFYTILLFIPVSFINGLPYSKPYDVKEFTSARIVGGKPAPDGFAPHMVALVVGDLFRILVCGGSIVLTAAHCIEAVMIWDHGDIHATPELLPSLRGIVGTNEYTANLYKNQVMFSNYTIHPEYQPYTIKNDVGLLITTKNIRFNDKIGVIPLKRKWVDGGEKSYVAGWGTDENFVTPVHLQYLHITTLTDDECIAGVHQATELLGPAPHIDPAVEICALLTQGHGMCFGDSGSALVSERTGQQIGIVSWGFPCALGFPDMFVRISGVWDFIQPHITPASIEKS
ncbi:chymotrypsin-1-like [Pectinophora gossypiella]|uniref:chymotrypsin-1-like n=1 Tax=Pectinophora gossypiella TaxID=13191 RepID=UPI00214ED025|nr:chymotrypsin-1-like [Pectinophora gossypiella]